MNETPQAVEAATFPAVPGPSTSDAAVANARLRRDSENRRAAMELVHRHVAAQSRVPFRNLLAEMIEGAPTPEAIRRFADKHPDRWAQALSILGTLSGYERGVIEVNIFNIKGLSDSELMGQLADVEAKIEALRRRQAGTPATPAEAVDAEVVEMKGKSSPAVVNIMDMVDNMAVVGEAEKASPAARAGQSVGTYEQLPTNCNESSILVSSEKSITSSAAFRADMLDTPPAV